MASVFQQVLWVLKKAGRSAKKSTRYYINNPREAWEDLVAYARENPWEFAVTCSLIVGGVLIIVLPLVIGFGPAGPILGSIAAGWQSGIGAVAAGSLFAVLQSLAMTGVFTGIGAGLIALGIQAPLTSSLLRLTLQSFRGLDRLEGPPTRPWFLCREHIGSSDPTTTSPSSGAEEIVKRVLLTNSKATHEMVWGDLDPTTNRSTVKEHALNGFGVSIRLIEGPKIEPGEEGFYECFMDHEWKCNENCECTGDLEDVKFY